MAELTGKVALITGTARGQGRSHAIRLAEAGAAIIALDICAPVDGIAYDMATSADLAQTEQLVQATGVRVITAQVDIRNFVALTATVNEAVTKLGGLDIAVANAGVAVVGRSEDFNQEQWDAVIGVNLTGTWNTMRAVVPHLIARGRGSIIAISSVAGLAGIPFLDPYVASKHGIIGLVRALSVELAEENIRVNAICPTTVETVMAKTLISSPVVKTASEKLKAAFENAMNVEAVKKSDVSGAVLYLASDDARFITGTALPVDAGLLAL